MPAPSARRRPGAASELSVAWPLCEGGCGIGALVVIMDRTRCCTCSACSCKWSDPPLLQRLERKMQAAALMLLLNRNVPDDVQAVVSSGYLLRDTKC